MDKIIRIEAKQRVSNEIIRADFIYRSLAPGKYRIVKSRYVLHPGKRLEELINDDELNDYLAMHGDTMAEVKVQTRGLPESDLIPLL